MKKLLWSLLLLVCLELSLAQPAITNVQPLPDLLGVDNPRFPLLSPDGNTIFYHQDNTLCFFSISTETTQCHDYAETFGGFGRYSMPVWSPDSSRILFTESFFDMFRESDLWQLEVETGEYTNLTDDGVQKFDIGNEDPAMTIDYLPTFSPQSQLYFFRSRPTEGINEVLGPKFSLELFKLNEIGEAVRVSSLRPQLPVLAVSQPAFISPDGKRIAFMVAPPTRDDPTAGVWVQDLATGQREHVLPLTAMPETRPKWDAALPLLPVRLPWLGNESVMVDVDAKVRSEMFDRNSFYLELKTKQVTPLENFSDVTKEMTEAKESKVLNYLPEAGFITSDGARYIYTYWSSQSGELLFWSQSIPFDGNATLLETVSDVDISLQTLLAPSSVSTDGNRALVAGCLLTLE